MTRREALAMLGTGLCGPSLVRAQTRLARVDVVVRTKAGALVRGLGIEDFAIEESGLRRPVQTFSLSAARPLLAGLLIDTSPAQRRVFEEERRAGYAFLDRGLAASRENHAFVMQFDSRRKTDPNRVTAPLVRARCAAGCANVSDRGQLLQKPPGGYLIGANENLYDAIVLACRKYLLSPDRKVCLVLSNGVDYGSEATLAEAIEAAQRAETPVYTIFAVDRRTYRQLPVDGARVLQRIAQETGGACFAISETQTLAQAFAQIEEDLDSAWTLGFAPASAIPGYRPIRVSVNRADLIVQARTACYAGLPAVPSPHTTNISSVDPVIAKPGDTVTAIGTGLDRSRIDAVYLTDGTSTVEAPLREQNATAIAFQVPPALAPGNWKEGERRDFQWTIVLRTLRGELLNYLGTRIAIQ